MSLRRSLSWFTIFVGLVLSARAQTIVLTPSSTNIGSTGGTLTFTATITYTSNPSVLAFSATLPAGWTYLSGNNEPQVKPAAGTTGELGWVYTTAVPASPATFTFTASYPAGLNGLQPLTTQTVTRATVESAPVTTSGPSVVISAPATAFTWTTNATGNWNDPTKWSPTGTVPNNSGNSTYSAQIDSGTVTVPSATTITVNELLLLGGTINGAGSLNLAGTASSWSDGAFASLALLTIQSGAQLTVSANKAHDFDATAIVNRGTVRWTDGGDLRSGNGGSFINVQGATFIDATTSGNDRVISNQFGGDFTFTNAGTYTKNVAGSTTRIAIPFFNSGDIRIDAGTIRFASTFIQNSGSLRIASGAVGSFDTTLAFTAGTLNGDGTVKGNATIGVSNAGTPRSIAPLTSGTTAVISPGDTLGRLTIDGNLTLLATSKLLIDLGGTTQGVNYDFLSVTGNAALGGTLEINFTNGFAASASPSTTFTVVTATTLTGAFANVPISGTRLLTNDGVSSFLVNYTANSVTLTNFVPIPEPSTWALMIAGLGVLALGAWRKKK